MSTRIITISREFGSGGRTIGKLVAQRLGVAFYDREIIERVSETTGFSEEYIAERGEYAVSNHMFSYAFTGWAMNGMSVDDYLWTKQRQTILELAEQGPCVIVGRCADYILKDRSDSIHIFVHGEMETKKRRIVELYGETDSSPEKRLVEKDKKRRIQYHHYTGQEWGKTQNYTVALNSSVLGIERCVSIVMEAAQVLV